MSILRGTTSADHIIGTAVGDTIIGNAGNDILEGGGGNDVLRGGPGSDTLYGGDGSDTISGGRGSDLLWGGAGNDVFLFANGDGKDVIGDFAQGDMVRITGYTAAQAVTQVGTDVVVTLSATDKITVSSASLATVQGALHFGTGAVAGGTGGSTGSTITGTDGWDTLTGTGGNDIIKGLGGYDVIHGGGGNDRIYGGLGGDALYGGAGADVFVYTSAAEGPQYGLMYYEWDTIYDFQSIDKIDLSAIDANTSVAGNQAFHFAGFLDAAEYAPDHSAGELYIRGSSQYGDIIAFTNDDTTPDFFLEVQLGAGQAPPLPENLIM